MVGARQRALGEQIRRARSVEQRRAVAMLRAEGKTWEEIGATLGITRQTARRLFDASLQRVNAMTETALARIGEASLPAGPDDQRTAVLELRKVGWSYAEIASQTGHPESTVRDWVHEELRRNAAAELHDTSELRQLEAERLDALQKAIWAKAEAGEYEATQIVLKIMAQRSKLMGLDTPVTSDVLEEIRSVALEIGVDPDEAVKEAEVIIKQIRTRTVRR